MASKTQAQIDRVLEHRQGTGFREHLGASIIGRECAREVWYKFRWAKKAFFSGRMLRLFNRGHREEDSLAKFLRQSGVHVLTADPETGEQFHISDHEGHFGGSLDLKLFDTPDFPGIWVLGEAKTHSDKSFKKVVAQGILGAKPEHFVQMQIYMHYEQLPAAIYFAVNKNDDELYAPVVMYDEAVAEKYIDRAYKIIYAMEPPERISNSPGWYMCKFCDYKDICHYGDTKEKNCRTCSHSRPIEGGKWHCRRYDYVLERLDQLRGCADHEEIQER